MSGLSAGELCLLSRAIGLAAESRANGDHPFGALLAVDGEVIGEAHNRVHSDHDITAHAELMLVRGLERDDRLPMLAQGTVYASCEPCPMCVGAMFWAGARRIVFGLSAERLNVIANPPGIRFGFTLSASALGASAEPALEFVGPAGDQQAAEAVHVAYW